MTQIANSGVRFAVGTGDTAYPERHADELRRPAPDGLGRQRHLRAAVLDEGRRLDPVLQRDRQPRLQQHLPVDWPQATAASSSGGRYAMDTYCCVNGTNSASYPSAWYAFDAGNARFYVLEAAWGSSNVGTADEYKNDYDTHWTPGSPEYQWLANDLAGHPSQLKFAFFHFPMYSSNATESSDPWLRGREQPRGPARAQRRGHRLQRPRAQLHAQREAGRRPRHLRHRRRRRSAAAGHEVQRAGGVRDRVVVHDRRERLRAPLRPTSIDQVFHFLKVSVDGSKVTVAPDRLAGPDVRRADLRLLGGSRHRRRRRLRRRARRAGAAGHGGASTAAAVASPSRSPPGAGHALVAAIAVQAGTTTTSRELRDRLRRERVDARARWASWPARTRASRSGTRRARRPGGTGDGEPLRRGHRQRQRVRVERGGADAGRRCVRRPGERLGHDGADARRSRPRTRTTLSSARSTSRARSRRRWRRRASPRSTTSTRRRSAGGRRTGSSRRPAATRSPGRCRERPRAAAPSSP